MLTNRSTQTLAALAAALCFAVLGALELAHEQVSPFAGFLDYAIEGLFVAALAASAVALWHLADGGARVAWRVAAAGHAILVLPAGATFLRGDEALGVAFPLGMLAILIGVLAAAVLDVRGKVVPRRAGLVLLAGWVATVPTDNTVALGLAWLAVAALAGGLAPARRAQPAA